MLHQAKNYSHAKQSPVVNRLSVFQSPDEDDEEDYEQWLEIKGKLCHVVCFGSSSTNPSDGENRILSVLVPRGGLGFGPTQ